MEAQEEISVSGLLHRELEATGKGKSQAGGGSRTNNQVGSERKKGKGIGTVIRKKLNLHEADLKRRAGSIVWNQPLSSDRTNRRDQEGEGR